MTSNNLKDITGTPPRTTSVAVEQAIIANNRHIKYLNFDDHGFSVLDLTPKRAQMDWFVISDRADRDAVDHLDDVVRHPGRQQPVVAVDQPVGADVRSSTPVEPVETATGAAAPHPRHRRRGRAGLLDRAARRRRWPRRRAGRGSAPTCWSSTAAGPTRSRRR